MILTGELTHSISNVPHAPVISIIAQKLSIHYALLSVMFNLLQASKTVWKHLCNQSSHYEKYEGFLLHIGSHHMQPPNWHISLTAKMNGSQRRNAWYVLQYTKRHLSGWSGAKQWENQVHTQPLLSYASLQTSVS